MDWQTTAQQWGSLLVDRWSQAEFIQPYEVQKLRLQQLGELGLFEEGQPGIVAPAQPAGLTITPTMLLLLGGVALVFVMMRD